MGAVKVDARQAQFILGMKGQTLDPAALDRQLRDYLRSQARLGALVQDRIFRRRFELPPRAQRLVSTLLARPHTTVDKSEARELLEQLTDLLDELKGMAERMSEVGAALQGVKAVVPKGSPAHRAAEQCLVQLGREGAQLNRAIGSVGVARPAAGGYSGQALCEFSASVLAVVVVAHGVGQRLPRLLARLQAK